MPMFETWEGESQHYVAGFIGATKEEAALMALVGEDWEKQARLADMEWRWQVEKKIRAADAKYERILLIKAAILLLAGPKLFSQIFPKDVEAGFDEEATIWCRMVGLVSLAIGRHHHDNDGTKSYDYCTPAYFAAYSSGYGVGAMLIRVHPTRFRVEVCSDYECLM